MSRSRFASHVAPLAEPLRNRSLQRRARRLSIGSAEFVVGSGPPDERVRPKPVARPIPTRADFGSGWSTWPLYWRRGRAGPGHLDYFLLRA